MKKKDIILIIVILLIAGIMYVAVQYAQWGQGTTVKINVDGKTYGTYPMGKYKTIEIKTSKSLYSVGIEPINRIKYPQEWFTSKIDDNVRGTIENK